MKKTTLGLIASILAIICLISLLIYFRPHIIYYHNLIHPFNYIVLKEDHKVIDSADKLRIGMEESQVIELLGKPNVVDKRKFITISHGDPSEYGRVIENKNKAFWYSTGIDYIILVVFDESGKVSYLQIGGT